MSGPEYRSLTLKKMQAKKWRLNVEVTSGVMSIPAGADVEIVRKGGSAVDISGPRCKHCGVRIFMRKVCPAHVGEVV